MAARIGVETWFFNRNGFTLDHAGDPSTIRAAWEDAANQERDHFEAVLAKGHRLERVPGGQWQCHDCERLFISLYNVLEQSGCTDLKGNSYPKSEPGVIDLGHRHFVWHQSEGIWLWWHDCPAVAHVSWGWFGQSVDGSRSSHHEIRSDAPLTVNGSLICQECGDHGYIENGAWRVA